MSQKKKKDQRFSSVRRLAKKPAFIVSAALVTMCLVAAPIVAAQSIQQQINSLSNQNTQTQSSVNSLQLQASSYQDAINTLQTQISAIQAAIAASQAQQASLEQQIEQAQAELDQQKKVLSSDIKAMYVDGQMSTIEELATSKNLSDFVDAETYRGAVQGEVQKTLTQISQLENQLTDQKNQVDQVIKVQQSQNDQLASDEQQQQQLLSYNQSQQDQYNQQIQSNQKQISSLEAQQAAINERGTRSVASPSGGSGGNCDRGQGNGGYPMVWCNASQDSLTTDGGFPNRECTSFAYWYFTAIEGHTSLYVTGNANNWANTASGSGIYVDRTPQVGAIAVDTSGPFGHVMIVTATPGSGVPSGYIDTISMNDGYDGMFYSMQRSSAGFYYIHAN